MAWEENPRICLHMQLIAILSRTGVVFITSNHSMNSSDKRGGQLKPLPIVIKDGCWIGANVTILPGTIIEEGCVIAAGSVVKGVCKINSLYAGVPAKKIKDLESC